MDKKEHKDTQTPRHKGLLYKCFVPSWLCVFVFSLAGIGLAAAPDRHGFVGHWVLNSEESDQPAGLNGRGPETDAGGRGGRGGWGGGGGGRRGRMGGGGFGGGGGRMGGQRPDPEQMEKMREVINAMRQAPRRLVIIEKEDALVLTDEKGDIQRLIPDGQKHKQIFGTVQVDRTTKWKENDLVTEIDAGGGVKLVQTYRVLPETKQLSVTGTLDAARAGNRGRGMTFVYITDFDGDGRSDVLTYAGGAWTQAFNTGLGSFRFTSGAWSSGLSIIANTTR